MTKKGRSSFETVNSVIVKTHLHKKPLPFFGALGASRGADSKQQKKRATVRGTSTERQCHKKGEEGGNRQFCCVIIKDSSRAPPRHALKVRYSRGTKVSSQIVVFVASRSRLQCPKKRDESLLEATRNCWRHDEGSRLHP